MSEEGRKCMNLIRKRGFQSGLFDTWDFGAQWIFHLLGIEKVFAFNKITLLTYQMEYAGTYENLPKNVPGFFEMGILPQLLIIYQYILTSAKTHKSNTNDMHNISDPA
jgi:hypothetical protein